MSRQRFLEVETAVTGIQLDKLTDDTNANQLHEHGGVGWEDMPAPQNGWQTTVQTQYRATDDGFIEIRGQVSGTNRVNDNGVSQTIFEFPNPGDEAYAPISSISYAQPYRGPADEPRTTTFTIGRAGDGSSSVQLAPTGGLANQAMGELYIDLQVPMLLPNVSKIYGLGDSYVFGSLGAVPTVSGISIVSRLKDPNFANPPPVQAGQTTLNVVNWISLFKQQIQLMPGPVMVYMTIGTVDENLGNPGQTVAARIDYIVRELMETREDLTILHSGYNFEASFPSQFRFYIQSPTIYPDRYTFFDLYPFDSEISQVGGGDNHPDAAGYQRRCEILWENADLIPALPDWPQTFGGHSP